MNKSSLLAGAFFIICVVVSLFASENSMTLSRFSPRIKPVETDITVIVPKGFQWHVHEAILAQIGNHTTQYSEGKAIAYIDCEKQYFESLIALLKGARENIPIKDVIKTLYCSEDLSHQVKRLWKLAKNLPQLISYLKINIDPRVSLLVAYEMDRRALFLDFDKAAKYWKDSLVGDHLKKHELVKNKSDEDYSFVKIEDRRVHFKDDN